MTTLASYTNTISNARILELPPKLNIPSKDTSSRESLKNLPAVPNPDIRDAIVLKGIAHYTPEKIDDILRLLNEALVNASLACKTMKDEGRIVRILQEIQVRCLVGGFKRSSIQSNNVFGK